MEEKKKYDDKKVTFYKVWKKTKPYMTIPMDSLDYFNPDISGDLGFSIYEKKNIPAQYYRKLPKTDKATNRLINRLKSYGCPAVEIANTDNKGIRELGWDSYDGYEYKLKKNKEAYMITKSLLSESEQHSTLCGSRIAHFFKDSKAPYDENTGILTFAFARVANTMNEKFAKYDFIIYYYEDAWLACSQKERQILVDHELAHCGIDGEPFIRSHDIQEFQYIANKYILNPPDYNWAADATRKVLSGRATT